MHTGGMRPFLIHGFLCFCSARGVCADEAPCTLEVCKAILSALATLHDYGVIHNDLEARHIMVIADLGVGRGSGS